MSVDRFDRIADPAEHEPLIDAAWDAPSARAFVVETIRSFDRAYDGERGWPVHPDEEPNVANRAWHGLYCGAAGTMWALVHLAKRSGVTLVNDYAEGIARVEVSYRNDPAETQTTVPSYFVGTVGIMLARCALSRDVDCARLIAEVAGNLRNPTREPLWGASGTAFAPLLLRERESTDRYDATIRAVQDELWATWSRTSLLWTQDLHGHRMRYFGAAHGAVGNLVPFVRASSLLSKRRRSALMHRIHALLERYVLRDADAANWASTGEPIDGNRMQWCHGAPGVIIALAGLPRTMNGSKSCSSPAVRASGAPVRCAKARRCATEPPATGFALLRMAERTGDERWRTRARCFAMHAMHQVQAWRSASPVHAASLWTGELGVALFIDAVVRDDPRILSIDVM